DRFTPISLAFQTEPLKPIAQLERRDAVVTVARFDRIANLGSQRVRVLLRDRVLHGAKMAGRLPEIDLPHEPIERFELLDGVAVDSGAKPLPNDAVDIHE